MTDAAGNINQDGPVPAGMPPSGKRCRGSSRFEFAAAVVVLVVPLLYMVTDCSPNAVFWRYSAGKLLAIGVFALFAAGLLLSYRMNLGRALPGLRTWLIVLGVSLMLSVLAAELILRAMNPARYTPTGNHGHYAADPDVGHRYLPNQDKLIVTREFRTPWRTNGEGVRADRDFGPRPAGVRRILAIGDSFTVGDQVVLRETWPGVLEAGLVEAFGRGSVEVINAGCAGYGTVNEARWIAKFASGFEPDIVVLAMTPNDLLENRVPLLYTAADGALINTRTTEAVRGCWEHRRQWYSIPGYVRRSRIRHALRHSPAIRRLRHGTAYTHHLAYQIEQSAASRRHYERMHRYLLEARDAAVACGARFALLAIPFREQLSDLEPGLSPKVWGERMGRFAAEHEIPFADALPAFLAADDPASLYWPEDSHCTASGYKITGETAVALIRTMVEWQIRDGSTIADLGGSATGSDCHAERPMGSTE